MRPPHGGRERRSRDGYVHWPHRQLESRSENRSSPPTAHTTPSVHNRAHSGRSTPAAGTEYHSTRSRHRTSATYRQNTRPTAQQPHQDNHRHEHQKSSCPAYAAGSPGTNRPRPPPPIPTSMDPTANRQPEICAPQHHSFRYKKTTSESGSRLTSCPPDAHKYCTAYARHGRHRRDLRSKADTDVGNPTYAAAVFTPRSVGKNASGSPNARMAIVSTVHGPTPGSARNKKRASSQSQPGPNSNPPPVTASAKVFTVSRRTDGIANTAVRSALHNVSIDGNSFPRPPPGSSTLSPNAATKRPAWVRAARVDTC